MYTYICAEAFFGGGGEGGGGGAFIYISAPPAAGVPQRHWGEASLIELAPSRSPRFAMYRAQWLTCSVSNPSTLISMILAIKS